MNRGIRVWVVEENDDGPDTPYWCLGRICGTEALAQQDREERLAKNPRVPVKVHAWEVSGPVTVWAVFKEDPRDPEHHNCGELDSLWPTKGEAESRCRTVEGREAMACRVEERQVGA